MPKALRKEQVLIPLVRAVAHRPRLAEFVFSRDRWGNPLADDVMANPYPMAELMRADGPVAYHALYQQYFITGYDEAKQALSADTVSTSGQIDVLMTVRPYNKLSREAEFFMRNFLVVVDPPDHGRLRRLVSKAFTPRRIAELEPRVQELADGLVNDLVASGDANPDVVTGLTLPLPINVIADMLGIPEERWAWTRSTTEMAAAMFDALDGFDADAVNAQFVDMFEYYGELAEERRQHPKDDLITALVQAEDDGDQLTNDELITMVILLMGAGHETTAGILGNSIVALADHPEERAKLLANPELWPNAVEELIRFDTSVKISPRQAAVDMMVGDTEIKAGSNMLISLLGANRDPRRFDRPNELIVDRDDPRPLSFSHGIHHCLGAALARMEVRVGLQAFLNVYGEYTIDRDSLAWKHSGTFRAPTNLRVHAG